MSTVAADPAASGSERSQIRRAQRKHTLHCLRIGVQQRVHHRQELQCCDNIFASNEVEKLAMSVAVHRCDRAATEHDHHFAAVSNLDAFQKNFKSSSTFKSHRQLHRIANYIKHDESPVQLPPPPPPPPCDELPMQATLCCELEAALHAKHSQPSFVPFSGTA